MSALPGTLLYGRTALGENLPVLVDASGLLAGGGNPFDQDLNTTDSPTFAALTLAGKLSSYNGVATSGWGVPVIQKLTRATAQTAAVATLCQYTCGAADGSFEVSMNVNVTTYVSGTFTAQFSYTDETNTVVTSNFNLHGPSGYGPNIAAASAFEGQMLHLRVKASTVITLLTAGTFTSLTYNAEGCIKQIG